MREKAKRERAHAEREAAGLPPRRKGWNGLQARPEAIYKRSPAEAKAAGRLGGLACGRRRSGRVQVQAVREAREILASLRRANGVERTIGPVEVLHRFWQRAYELGYAKGWRQRRRAKREAA